MIQMLKLEQQSHLCLYLQKYYDKQNSCIQQIQLEGSNKEMGSKTAIDHL